MSSTLRRRALALTFGLACHGAFLAAVSCMALALWSGMQSGLGPFTGGAAWIANAALILQFPLLHSFLLSKRGRRVLTSLAPGEAGRTLAPTTYSLSASLQLLVTFLLWSPSGEVLWRPTGTALALHAGLFAASWLFLLKALHDAGLGLQSGSIGWMALWRGETPRYPGLPQRGLFARCRQPIYLGFALLLWTGPVWTPDHLAIAIAWTAYCVLGPLHKESRFARQYGTDFDAYRRRVPYFLPRIHS